MTRKQLAFRRPLFIFRVERYDAMLDHWKDCGSVLLPDNAYRMELAHALLVFGLHAPRSGDRVSWTYGTIPGSLVFPRPRVKISDTHNRPLVRLSAKDRSSLGASHESCE